MITEGMFRTNNIKGTPIENSKSTPLALSAHVCGRYQYVISEQIIELAIEKYKTKDGRRITFTDLLESGLTEDKGQAQHMLKYHKRKGTLFILEALRAQQYYPTEEDRTRIITFFGQIRDRLTTLLNDKHERLVPDILNWQLTECDINKDIEVSDILHFSAIKVQVRHLDHLFSLYIKSMGKDNVCRVEETKHSANRAAIEVINDIFNPTDRFEKKLTEQDIKLNEINDKLTRLVDNRGVTGSSQ